LDDIEKDLDQHLNSQLITEAEGSRRGDRVIAVRKKIKLLDTEFDSRS
jgi:hypothetical protein